uniref:Uncharacterized protein n=1 Tax=Desulfovibrio sp. U5L TaxID=596152 RepID=I2Q567_9BACT
MAYFQNPDPVKITPLDLGEIKKENALSELINQRQQDMAYESNAKNALNEAIKRDPTGQNVLRDVAARGFGSSALDAVGKMGTNALRNAQIAKAQTDFISTYAPLIKDQASLDMVRAKYNGTFGQDVPQQFHTYYDGLGQDALKLSLGAAGNIQLQRNDATGAAVGAPPGVDVGTWNSVNMARNADNRAADANSRAQALFPGQMAQQGATFEHTQASTESLRNKQQIIYGPDPTDWRGKKKVPGIVMPGENGGPGTFTPLQGIQGQQSGGSGDETQGGSIPQGGQAAGQATQGSPVPGARQAPDGNWYVPDSTRPGKYLRVN